MTEEELDQIRGTLYAVMGYIENSYGIDYAKFYPYTIEGRAELRAEAIEHTGDNECVLVRVLDAVDIVEANRNEIVEWDCKEPLLKRDA